MCLLQQKLLERAHVMPRNAKQTQRTRLISLSIKRQGPNPAKEEGRWCWGCVFDFSLAYETCERGPPTLNDKREQRRGWEGGRGHDKTPATTTTQINCIKMLYTLAIVGLSKNPFWQPSNCQLNWVSVPLPPTPLSLSPPFACVKCKKFVLLNKRN